MGDTIQGEIVTLNTLSMSYLWEGAINHKQRIAPLYRVQSVRQVRNCQSLAYHTPVLYSSY